MPSKNQLPEVQLGFDPSGEPVVYGFIELGQNSEMVANIRDKWLAVSDNIMLADPDPNN